MPSSDFYDSVTILSKSTILPDSKSPIGTLPLSVSDLPMLTCQYIQKGCLFSGTPSDSLAGDLKKSLSKALSVYPPLAGRLITDSDSGHVSLACSDDGALFIHARASSLHLGDIFYSSGGDIPAAFRRFFAFDNTISYDGHTKPISAVQVTELADAVFIGCSVNHAVVDGTSFWNFFNTFAEISRGETKLSRPPCYSRDNVLHTNAVLRFPGGKPEASFSGGEPIRERIFHFSRQAVLLLKKRANESLRSANGVCDEQTAEIMGKRSNDTWTAENGKAVVNPTAEALKKRANGDVRDEQTAEIMGKRSNDTWTVENGKAVVNPMAEISSFQSLSAQLWRSVTRARNLPPAKTTTFRMAVNVRHRVNPKMDPLYFGNAIQSIPTVALSGDVLSRELGWSADLLHRSVRVHDDRRVRLGVEAWERDPRRFPLGNFDGAMITMGSSPRFPMYDNDFGWGRPVAVRSGGANKFDGKISAFPGRDGDGSVDLEVVLAPETMEGLERDGEFMQYVS